MKCPACGAEVEEVSIYCPKCGERVEGPDESMPSMGDPEEPQEEAAAAEAPAAPQTPAPGTSPPQTPADALKDSVAARQELADDEELELWKGRYAKRTMVGTWLLCGLITIALLVLGIWVGRKTLWIILVVLLLAMWGYPTLVLMYRRLSIRYRLTTQRFFHQKGILRRVTDRIEVIDIDDISYDQTILERMVNVGTIHVTSSDRSHPVLHIYGIENVEEVASMMDTARRKERIRRGLHIEAV